MCILLYPAKFFVVIAVAVAIALERDLKLKQLASDSSIHISSSINHNYVADLFFIPRVQSS